MLRVAMGLLRVTGALLRNAQALLPFTGALLRAAQALLPFTGALLRVAQILLRVTGTLLRNAQALLLFTGTLLRVAQALLPFTGALLFRSSRVVVPNSKRIFTVGGGNLEEILGQALKRPKNWGIIDVWNWENQKIADIPCKSGFPNEDIIHK
ncbi:hypothetical protein ACT29H_03850 [Thermophagus sp. OGC60D27]|uniref:hypothetical protein n=1 Tax=Thermophagus sp. OGC60D27 TaxID=3458415 RepID=UPI004037818D